MELDGSPIELLRRIGGLQLKVQTHRAIELEHQIRRHATQEWPDPLNIE